MLFMLQARNGQLMKISEIAEKLEVSPRMVREYKSDLELAGIYIESVSGKHGGYYAPQDMVVKVPKLNEEEINALSTARDYLARDPKYVFGREYNFAVDKIITAGDIHMSICAENMMYYQEESVRNDSRNQKDKYLQFNAAMIEKKKIEIVYFSNRNEKTYRIIHPYGLVAYKNAWYCIAFCELREEIRGFKLSRILNFEVLDEAFIQKPDFNLRDHVGRYQIFKGEKIEVALRIAPPLTNYVSERVWGDDQETHRDVEGYLIMTASMEDTPELTSWILSMGSMARVLAPEKLIRTIKAEIREMQGEN
jgi:predicted DNA-binding transcriptional regulator YafY